MTKRALAAAIGVVAGALLRPLVAFAGDVEALREQVDRQSALIRQQSEALERQSREMQQMGDRLRALEDERDQVAASAPAGTGVAAPSAGGPAAAPAPHRAGAGFPLARTEWGAANLRLYASLRYLNQRGLDEVYTDSFGVKTELDRRQDIHLQKVNLQFNGWVLDERLRYLLYVWSANTSQGLGAQVIVAGNLNFEVADWLTLSGGTGSLPGVRSTSGNFPFWLTQDNRLIADEFFRPSYTFGIWASGDLPQNLRYQIMLGNNLSQLGVDAGQLDSGLNSLSATLAWQPQGDYGAGFGDWENHENVSTRLAAHFTRSREDAQSQPNTDSFENVTVRLSDGNVVFEPDLFGPGVRVRDVTYQMAAVDAGIKYRGLSLEAEYYYRWLDNFRGPGTDPLPFDTLNDHGFQVQTSAMVIPEKLQAYVVGSMVFGEYGEPWDARLGVNWFPFDTRALRWNNELMWVDESPVGGLSLPYQVGANGLIFSSNVELNF